jgi:hypothetical protein
MSAALRGWSALLPGPAYSDQESSAGCACDATVIVSSMIEASPASRSSTADRAISSRGSSGRSTNTAANARGGSRGPAIGSGSTRSPAVGWVRLRAWAREAIAEAIDRATAMAVHRCIIASLDYRRARPGCTRFLDGKRHRM